MSYPLPFLHGRTLMSVEGTVVSWTDLQGELHRTPLSEWLDLVPAYVSTYPHGNKLSDELAEAHHLNVMGYWRAVASPKPARKEHGQYTSDSLDATLAEADEAGLLDSSGIMVNVGVLRKVAEELKRLRK